MSFKKDIFCAFKNENILEQMIEYVCMCMHAQSCLTFCDPIDCNPPNSSVHVIFQARIVKWVAIPFSRGSSWPRDWTQVSCLAADSLLFEPSGKPQVRIKEAKLIKSIQFRWLQNCHLVLANGRNWKKLETWRHAK